MTEAGLFFALGFLMGLSAGAIFGWYARKLLLIVRGESAMRRVLQEYAELGDAQAAATKVVYDSGKRFPAWQHGGPRGEA